MVDIIKSEDLSLDEIKSRIINLNSRFKQGEFRFVQHSSAYDSYLQPNDKDGLSEFTHLLTQHTSSEYIFPEYSFDMHVDLASSKPTGEALLSIIERLEELLNTRTSRELKEALRYILKKLDEECPYDYLVSESHWHGYNIDPVYYTYLVNSEQTENSVLLHVNLTHAPVSEDHTQYDVNELVSLAKERIERMYGGFGGFETILKNNDRIRLITSEFDDVAALIENFFDKLDNYCLLMIERTKSYKPIPKIENEYLLTVELNKHEYESLVGLSKVSKIADIHPNKLNDITDSLEGVHYKFIQSLRDRLNVYKHINEYTIFDGHGSPKKLEDGKMSINQAKSYATDWEMKESTNKDYEDYVSDALKNLNELLDNIENYDIDVYLELTRFKVNASRMLKEAFSNTYKQTLEELQYSDNWRRFGLEYHLDRLAGGRETQEELNNLISKWESDIDEIESLMRRIQSDFNDCLARCSKIIEGE